MADIIRGAKNSKLVKIPKADIGVPNKFDKGLFVAASQFKNEEMSQSPPSPIVVGK